jgi:hypothetical protein
MFVEGFALNTSHRITMRQKKIWVKESPLDGQLLPSFV